MERLPRRTEVLFWTPLGRRIKRRATRGYIDSYITEPDGSTTCSIYDPATGGCACIPYQPELVTPLRNRRRGRR